MTALRKTDNFVDPFDEQPNGCGLDGLEDFFADPSTDDMSFGAVRSYIDKLQVELEETNQQLRDVSVQRNELEQKITSHLAQVKKFTDKYFIRHKNAS